MGENAITIASTSQAAPAGRAWWDLLRLDDPRYPRPALLAGLRTVGRLGWLPATVYLGNAATNLVTTLSGHGVAAVSTLDGFAGALQLGGFLQLAQRNLWAAAAIVALLAALGVLIYLAQRDTRREAAVARMRDMTRLLQERSTRTMTAETLRDELRTLQAELATDSSALQREAKQAANAASDDATSQDSTLAERLARLAEISEMLSRDLGAQALWDELMRQRMARWQRRQRLLSAAMGAATILIGGLLPMLLGL